jgi:dihydroorotase
MNILIKNGRVIDPASSFDAVADLALADGRVHAIKTIPQDFAPARVIDAKGCLVMPGLVDLSARLGEPGYEHEGMLGSEMSAAVAGGVTSLVCPPDTDPVLDEPGLVDMLQYRSQKLNRARVLPLGALTRGLKGEVLSELMELTEAGCVGFTQAEASLADTQVMQRALQYASTYGYAVWLRPQDVHLGRGVAASGALATRLGLPGVPVAAETIALHTIFELVAATGARVHLCRLSSAAGVELVRQAKERGLPVTCDVSINSLHLTDVDIGYFDTRMRVTPPLRQQRDRDALRQGLAEGTIDALVSDHTPVTEESKALPFGEAAPGATGLELLLGLAMKWGQESRLDLSRVIAVLTSEPARVLGRALGALEGSVGQLTKGAVADVCIFDPQAHWTVGAAALRSQTKHTPFSGYELAGRVRCTVAGGQVVYEAADS